MAGKVKAETNSFLANYRSLLPAQKSAAGVSLYSRWINRPWGRVLAAAGHTIGLTPNQVTILSALVSLGGLAVLVLVAPTPGLGILVGFLLLLGFALDSADGQLARLRGGGSLRGEWLDHLVDSGKTVLVHAGVLVAAWRFYDLSDVWLLVPLGFLFVAVVQFSGILLTQFLLARRTNLDPPRRPSTLRAIILLPSDYGILAASFLLSGVPAIFVPVYTALGILTALITIALIVSWWGRLAEQ